MSAQEHRWGEDARLVDVLGERGAAEFRAVFDPFPEAIGVLWSIRDESGRVTDFSFGYGNPEMLRLAGLPPSTAERYTLLEALPRMQGSEAFEAYVRVCETGEPWVKEVVYDTPFGDGYMLGTFVHRAGRLGDGLIVFLHDVTERRRMEGELRGYANLVAHDLSEPLAGISLLVTLLEREADRPPSPETLAELRATAERARELVDGVLLYARSGELRRERIALGEVVREAARDLRARFEDAGGALEVGDLPEVEGDRRQLRRVFQNLFHNALKFCGAEPPRVEVTAAGTDEDADPGWIVAVADNGIGIKPEDAVRVFDMFTRIDRSADGAGIGLAVCRRIVEAHGGRIWAEPGKHGGTTFRFTFPAAEPARADAGLR